MGEHLQALERLSQKRTRLALVLTASIVGIYFTFITLIAFEKAIVAKLVTEGVSLGIFLGVVTTLIVWVATLIYILWANTYYDQAVDRIRKICIKRDDR